MARKLSKVIIRTRDLRREYLNTLLRESDRLGRLVENVLAFSRLERNGKTDHPRETKSVGDFLETIRGRLQQHATAWGMMVAVCWQDNAGSLKLCTDFCALEQILFNLLDNACKYAAGASDKTIHIQFRRKKGRAEFSVRDHGPGISSKDRHNIFRPFWRSQQDKSHTTGGVGLGLALCRRLARQLKGTLRFDKTCHDGACFVLTLPAGTAP